MSRLQWARDPISVTLEGFSAEGVVAPSHVRQARRIAKVRRRIETRQNGRTISTPKPIREQQTSGAPRTVLVVDDDDDIRFLVSELLRREGYSVTEACCAEDAERAALKQPPNLIIMDIGMPGLDGLSEVWRMREHPELVNVPVVIVTAYDSYDLRGEAAAQGCKGYLTKPVEASELTRLVAETFQNETSHLSSGIPRS